MEKEKEPFMLGSIFAIAAAALFWWLTHRMRKLKNENLLTMNLTLLIIITICIPAFFPFMDTSQPSAFQMILMLVMGFVGFAAMIFVSRSVQVMQSQNFMLFCTTFLVFKGVFDGYKEQDLDIGIITGSIISIVSICLVGRKIRSKDIITAKGLHEPIINN